MVFRFARTGLGNRETVPTISVTGNTFNAANEMTSFNGTPQTYDANGNLANDGTNTYSWDARNHLTAIVGPNTASFVYGPDGRRTQKAINGTSTQFLYDGLNPVQEIQNGALSANLITGLGIDEYFQRTDSAGARNYVTDILGSTLALTDSSGTTQTSYTYDPFGNTAATGQASSNPYQFTGRENDGTGLYLDRARFYSRTMQRFISQDPIGFRGGINLYKYAGNNPVTYFDPFGWQTATPTPACYEPTPIPVPTPLPNGPSSPACYKPPTFTPPPLTPCEERSLCSCDGGLACAFLCSPLDEIPPAMFGCDALCFERQEHFCAKEYPSCEW